MPKITTTPPDCSVDFKFVIKSVESQKLNQEQISDIIILESASNVIKIGTDDFATYANQEATVQL